MNKKISVVIACYQDALSIPEMYQRITKVFKDIIIDYEIIFVDDGSPDDSLQKAVALFEMDNRVKVIELSRNFGHHKAAMTGLSHAMGDYIFFIDADEYLSEELLENLKEILEQNNHTQLFLTPRINTVEGLTPEHIQRWGWNVNEKGWVNFPDHQTRIVKNEPEINWENKVHERLVGFKLYASLPDEYCLIHPKDIKRQERQNDFYSKL